MQLYNLISTDLQYDGVWAFVLDDLLYIFLNSATELQIKNSVSIK